MCISSISTENKHKFHCTFAKNDKKFIFWTLKNIVNFIYQNIKRITNFINWMLINIANFVNIEKDSEFCCLLLSCMCLVVSNLNPKILLKDNLTDSFFHNKKPHVFQLETNITQTKIFKSKTYMKEIFRILIQICKSNLQLYL